MRLPPLALPALLLLGILGGACAPDSPADLQPAVRSEPEPARLPRQSALRPPRAEARLISTGRLAYEGDGEPRCVVHGETGLQINLRTGDLDLPAVALRIAEYNGEGRYHGELFLTGRNGGGALLGSTGTVEVEIEVRPQTFMPSTTPGIQTVQVLGGTFEGRYAGMAGQGTVKGRFERCSYRPGRGMLQQLAKELENPSASRPTAVPGGP